VFDFAEHGSVTGSVFCQYISDGDATLGEPGVGAGPERCRSLIALIGVGSNAEILGGLTAANSGFRALRPIESPRYSPGIDEELIVVVPVSGSPARNPLRPCISRTDGADSEASPSAAPSLTLICGIQIA